MRIEIIYEIKTRIYSLIAGVTGTASTFVIDWNHIAERAIETCIMAILNGALAAIAGYVAVWVIKKVFKTKKDEKDSE